MQQQLDRSSVICKVTPALYHSYVTHNYKLTYRYDSKSENVSYTYSIRVQYYMTTTVPQTV